MNPSHTDPADSMPDEAIERYLAGRSHPDEAGRVERYLAASPGLSHYYQSLRTALGGAAADIGQPEAEQAYAQFVERMEQAQEQRREQRNSTDVTRHQWLGDQRRTALSEHRVARLTRYTAAPALIALLAIVFVWLRGVHPFGTRTMAAAMTYTTPNGQRANITLPDGSAVMLDVASRLEVPADFAMGDRTLRLTGEALFTVDHHANSGFTVLAGRSVTRVLGTEFLIRHYATDTTTIIAVREGKVGVGQVVLAARQQAIVATNGATHLQSADSTQFTFARGLLTLSGVPLRDAIHELDRWYDVDIHLADPALGDNLVQGAFAAGSPSDLSTILGFTFHAGVIRDGRTITLYPQ